MRRLNQRGFRVCLMHFRGCSGEPNRLPISYHSGKTDDPQRILEHIHSTKNRNIYAAVGVSLGGNVLLKWLGEQGERITLQKAVVISVPFQLDDAAKPPGVTHNGINETFPLEGLRSIYGAAKLASELILAEYSDAYNINAIINRCGILTGPWQMGRVEQGVVALWVARHLFGGPLTYIGFGGSGKQVRDMLHVRDLYDLLILQLNEAAKFSGQVFNVGGGKQNTVSLLELTQLCQRISGKQIAISRDPETRAVDIPWYVNNCAKIESLTQWRPKISVKGIIENIAAWMNEYQKQLQPIFFENRSN